jgi:molybdopterin synthase catalytic subunit
MTLRVQNAPFDPGHVLNTFTKHQASAGAVVSFSGVVRDVEDGLIGMEIEHFPGMTEKAIAAMMDTATARFQLSDVLVIHRFGRLSKAEIIMMVATAAPHRRAAFQGAEFLMDYLKSRAPFWKKEITSAGETWVTATCDDEHALSAWDFSS